MSGQPKIPLDPRARLALAAAAVLTSALLEKHRIDRFAGLLAVEATAAVALWLAGALRLSLVKRTLAIAAAAALPIASFALLRPGHALWSLGGGLAITSEGVVLSLGLLLAAACAGGAVALFAASTAPGDARAALRSAGVPEGAITNATLVTQQIGLAFDELARARRAAEARGAPPRGNLAFLAARGGLALAFGRALDRGARLDRALAARGFVGKLPGRPLGPLAARDALIAAAGCAALLSLLWLP